MNLYISLLKQMEFIYVLEHLLKPMELGIFPLLGGRKKSVAGSGIGGIKETQEMLDFFAENNIVSDIELIDIKDITNAYEKNA